MSGDAFVELSAATATGNDPFKEGTEVDSTLKNVSSIYDSWAAGLPVTVAFGNDTKEYYGEAIITSISIDAGVEENATYSISLTGTGALAKS